MSRTYDIAAYIWPAYTGKDPRAHIFWPEKRGEWQTVEHPTVKPEWDFADPRPLWGAADEADPAEMARQIDAAADHGVNVFIYDWYWYDDRPFLEQCLNEGFLRAENNARMKFYLMWANHPATTLWDKRNSNEETVIWQGKVDAAGFRRVTDRLIENYFSHPLYYRIDGRPVFMIYDMTNLIQGLGGVAATRAAFDDLRARCAAAGLPGIHLQACIWSEAAVNLGAIDAGRKGGTLETVTALGFDSVTHYQFVHMAGIRGEVPYGDALSHAIEEWQRVEVSYPVPYFPHVSIGWDNNLRHTAFFPDRIVGNTPEAVEIGLRKAKEFLDLHPERPPLVTINSWNEWTEGSYLEPDTVNGYGYLEAVKRVFKVES